MALKRSGFKRKYKTKKQKEEKKARVDKDKELAQEYGVTLSYWRYVGRKGIYWNQLSEYIRKRDFYKYGTCVSCGKTFNHWKDSQAGHYAPAGNCGFGLVFDPRNINAECPSCNNPRFSPGKLIPYRTELVKRYGETKIKQLDDEYASHSITKEWTQKEYDSEIKKLQRKIKKLDKDNGKTNQE